MGQAETNYELELARKFKLFVIPFILTLCFGGFYLFISRISCLISPLQSPITIVQGLSTLISLVGLVFACSRKPFVFWILLCVTLLLVVLHLSTIVLTYVAVGGEFREYGDWIEGKEYKIEDYSKWLREKVDTDSKWNKVRSCALLPNICEEAYITVRCGRIVSRVESPILSGCCKPPSECDLEYQRGAMEWDKPAEGIRVTPNNTDCTAWGGKRSVLCYDCQSCKAAVLAITKRDWEHLTLFSVLILVVYGIVLVCVIASVCYVSWQRRCVSQNKRILHFRL